MIIYKVDQPTDHTVFVTPAATPQGRETPEWMAGSEPRMYQVYFRAGRASVPDNLGRFMVDAGLARKSPILLPADIQLERANAF